MPRGRRFGSISSSVCLIFNYGLFSRLITLYARFSKLLKRNKIRSIPLSHHFYIVVSNKLSIQLFVPNVFRKSFYRWLVPNILMKSKVVKPTKMHHEINYRIVLCLRCRIISCVWLISLFIDLLCSFITTVIMSQLVNCLR